MILGCDALTSSLLKGFDPMRLFTKNPKVWGFFPLQGHLVETRERSLAMLY